MYRTSSIKFGGGDPFQVPPSCTSTLSTCTNVPLDFGRSTPSFLDLIMALMEEWWDSYTDNYNYMQLVVRELRQTVIIGSLDQNSETCVVIVLLVLIFEK